MTNVQVFGLGVVVVLGMAVQALVMRAPAAVATPSAARETPTSANVVSGDVAQINATSAEVLAVIARGPATTLVVGDHTLIVRTEWSRPGDGRHIQITNTYYEYKDGKLVQVPLVQTVGERR